MFYNLNWRKKGSSRSSSKICLQKIRIDDLKLPWALPHHWGWRCKLQPWILALRPIAPFQIVKTSRRYAVFYRSLHFFPANCHLIRWVKAMPFYVGVSKCGLRSWFQPLFDLRVIFDVLYDFLNHAGNFQVRQEKGNEAPEKKMAWA